jgi:hypothetical protein
MCCCRLILSLRNRFEIWQANIKKHFNQVILMKTHALFTVIAVVVFTICAKAQVVKGKVVDAATGNPIANASIYLDGSSKGTTSNTLGEFTLKTPETKTPLVVSCVGYQSDTILNYNNKLLNIKLKPHTNELNEVVISKGGGMSRERKLRIFVREFIGSNSKDCIITNTDDINLRYIESTGTLVGEATRPLIILNKKLGYKITYYLSAFSHSPIPTWYPTQTSYKGNYVFEEDTLGLTPADMEKILTARDKAYYGSRMHFVRSVWTNDLKANNFTHDYNMIHESQVYFIWHKINGTSHEQLLNTTLIVTGEKIRSFLRIAYNSTFAPGNSDKWSHIAFKNGADDVALSFTNSYDLHASIKGNKESELLWTGVIAEQRVSELLPYDFEPSEPLSNK